jgi:hypothetical protein
VPASAGEGTFAVEVEFDAGPLGGVLHARERVSVSP